MLVYARCPTRARSTPTSLPPVSFPSVQPRTIRACAGCSTSPHYSCCSTAGRAIACSIWVRAQASPPEMLARLGYDVVAVDPDAVALGHARRRATLDAPRIAGTVRVSCGVAQQVPCADGAFDGALCMNALHHVDDLPTAVAELARVLRPGARAVFCEPGLAHLDAAETQRARGEHGETAPRIRRAGVPAAGARRGIRRGDALGHAATTAAAAAPGGG